MNLKKPQDNEYKHKPRRRRKTLTGVAGLTAILICFATGALAQAPSQQPAPAFPPPFQNLFQGTPEEQAACRPDSNRFCRAEEPDPFRVLACLRRNRTEISAACRRVLESHGQ